MAQELLILSPEKTVLSFNLARLASRIYAFLIDLLIILFIEFVLAFALGSLSSLMVVTGSQGILTYIFVPLMVLGPFIYLILFEGFWNGQTLGKKALNIRVRMTDGTPVAFGAAIGRNLLIVADFLPGLFLFGLLAMFTNRNSQRIGDLAAGTIVTQERRAEPRFSPAPYVLGVHPFEAHVGELRGMTTDEYATLRKLCDRFPELPSRVQDNLIFEVWQPFADRFGIRPLENVHPVYLAEAVVMKYGRSHGLL